MKALSYSLKIWVTSLALGSTIYYLLELMAEPYMRGGISHWLACIQEVFLYSLLFSLPCFVLLLMSVALVNLITINMRVKKAILTVICIGLIILPFYFIETGWHWGQWAIRYAEAYGSLIIAGIWIYRLEPVYRSDTETVEEEV